MRLRVVLAEDHRLVRDGLCALLAREADIEVVGVADDGAAAVRLVQRLQPAVLVTDLSMPGLNGIECIRRARACEGGVRVLCLSMHGDARTVMSAIDAGATGYLLKDACCDDLVRGIRAVAAGHVHLSAALVDLVVQGARARSAAAPPLARTGPTLTAREREIAQLFSEGLSTQQIADRLHVTGKTVATHRENIMHKLGIHGIAELTRYALREGLSTLEVA